MSIDTPELKSVFDEFCSFGRGHNLPKGPLKMDSRTAQKLARDCGLSSSKDLDRTEVDLIFAKTKARGERKITFNEFVDMTREWADVKGVPHSEVLDSILSTKGPSLNGVTTPDYSKFYDDTSTYTATRRNEHLHSTERRMSSGSVRRPSNASSSHRRDTMDSADTAESYSEVMHPDWYAVDNPNAEDEDEKVYYVNKFTRETRWDRPLAPSRTKPRPRGAAARASFGSAPRTPAPREARPSASAGGGGASSSSRSGPHKSIFDKLTDPALYTGTHKHRFDSEGRGLGLRGRDSVSKTPGSSNSAGISFTGTPTKFKGRTNTRSDEVVHDLSQVLR